MIKAIPIHPMEMGQRCSTQNGEPLPLYATGRWVKCMFEARPHMAFDAFEWTASRGEIFPSQ